MNEDQSTIFHITHWKAGSQWVSKILSELASERIVLADEWQQRFRNAGLIPEVHILIPPKFNGGIFLLIDCLWHVKVSSWGELGDTLYSFLLENPKFPLAFRSVIAGLLEMETDWRYCRGAVFLVRKPLRATT